jgi:hypothetical protein
VTRLPFWNDWKSRLPSIVFGRLLLHSSQLVKQDGLVSQHDRDPVDDRIEDLVILTDQAAAEWHRDGMSNPVNETSREDRRVELLDQAVIGKLKPLVGLRTDEDIQ